MRLYLVLLAAVLLMTGCCASNRSAQPTAAQQKQSYDLFKNAGTEQRQIKDR
jgi:hypothetical protein